MGSEVQIEAGKPVDEALAAFRKSVNQPDTIFSTDHWLLPKLEQLRDLLEDPITQDQAKALLDVLHQRHWMADLIEWLENGSLDWESFFTVRSSLKQEAIRKRAEERKLKRVQGLEPYPGWREDHDEFFPQISDRCPDCGSSEWKPIAYGLPAEDTREDARLGEVVLGGCCFDDPKRYCVACFNRWPTKPDVSKPAGIPKWIEEQISASRASYARLSALADLPADPEEPHVERAWARIDRSIEFLVSWRGKKARFRKTLKFARLGGAPTFEISHSWSSYNEYARRSTLAAVAALRFERVNKPETHNLYNNWDIEQAHRKELKKSYPEDSFWPEQVTRSRTRLSELLKLARAAPEQLPRVVSMRVVKREGDFLVRFAWGAVKVRRYQFSLLESMDYHCESSCERAENPKLAQDLACAAAMLAEFPRLLKS
jgi:hypothetical protein